MPLAVMKLPMLHCATKGVNRNSDNWISRKTLKFRVFR
jgi:hypothetical protein